MDNKRKLADSQSSGCCASRNVRQRLGPSPPAPRDALVIQSNRQQYEPSDDPYYPGNAMPCNKVADMQFRRAYIRNSTSNAASDPLVRVCIQDCLNTKFNVQDIDSFSVMSDMDAFNSNMSESVMLEVGKLVDEEIVHKLSWLLAQRLNTSAKWETAMRQVVQATKTLHGYSVIPIDDGRLQLRLNGLEPADASNTALLTPPVSKPSQDPHGSIHHDTQVESRQMETNAASDPATTTEPNGGSSKGKRRQQRSKGSGPTTKAEPKGPLVKNSFRSRIKLFMFQQDKVLSLSKDEARLVFESPKYLFAWMNINHAIDQFDGEPRPYQVEEEINRWFKEDMDKAKADWNVFWDDLDNRYKSLAPLEQTEDGKRLYSNEPCSISVAHDAPGKEQDEQAVKVENSGTSRSLFKRADHPNSFPTKDSDAEIGEIDVVTMFTNLDNLDEAGPSTPKANRQPSFEASS